MISSWGLLSFVGRGFFLQNFWNSSSKSSFKTHGKEIREWIRESWSWTALNSLIITLYKCCYSFSNLTVPTSRQAQKRKAICFLYNLSTTLYYHIYIYIMNVHKSILPKAGDAKPSCWMMSVHTLFKKLGSWEMTINVVLVIDRRYSESHSTDSLSCRSYRVWCTWHFDQTNPCNKNMERNLQGNCWTMGETYKKMQAFFLLQPKKCYKKHQWFLRNLHLPSTYISKIKKKSLPQLPSRLQSRWLVGSSNSKMSQSRIIASEPQNGSWKPSSTSPSLNGECQVAEASSNFMRQPPLSSFTCKMLMQKAPSSAECGQGICVRAGCFGCFALFASSECLTKPRQTIPTKWEEEKSSTKN